MPALGLIDSGLDPAVIAAGAVLLGHGPALDAHGHGSVVSRLLAAAVTPSDLAGVAVFDHRGVTTPLAVAQALDLLVGQGVEMVVMALGLAHDREVLRLACQRAVAAGIMVVASAPARGGPCYPASYPGIVAVSGDARCQPDQTSYFGGQPALFGACVAPPPGVDRRFQGASMAAGHFAAWVWRHFPNRADRRMENLAAACLFQGRERIVGAFCVEKC